MTGGIRPLVMISLICARFQQKCLRLSSSFPSVSPSLRATGASEAGAGRQPVLLSEFAHRHQWTCCQLLAVRLPAREMKNAQEAPPADGKPPHRSRPGCARSGPLPGRRGPNTRLRSPLRRWSRSDEPRCRSLVTPTQRVARVSPGRG